MNEHQVCLFRIGFGFFHAHFFHYIPCFTDTGGITILTGMPSILIYSSTVSRVVPGMSVTMARSSSKNQFKREDLPTLGFPTITVWQTFPQDFPSVCPCKESFHTGKEFLCALLHGIVCFFFDVVVWIVNDSFDGSDHVDDFLTDPTDFCFQPAFQLVHSCLTGQLCFGLDQVNDGFCLGQVDTTIPGKPRFVNSPGSASLAPAFNSA